MATNPDTVLNPTYFVTVSTARSIIYTFKHLARALEFAYNAAKHPWQQGPVEVWNELDVRLWDSSKNPG